MNPAQVEYGAEASMQDWTGGGPVHQPVSQKVSLINITKPSLN